MSDPAVALVMLGILVFTICIGFPVAFTLMALGVGFGYYAYFQDAQAFFNNRVFYLLTQNTFTTMNNDVLVAIPLFLLMGYMVERSNLLDKLFFSVQLAFRRVPASLAVTTLLVSAFWGIASGIVGAVVVRSIALVNATLPSSCSSPSPVPSPCSPMTRTASTATRISCL